MLTQTCLPRPCFLRNRPVQAIMTSPRKPQTTGSVRNTGLSSNGAKFRTQVKKAMSMTEKILSKKSGSPSVSPGQNIWVNVDTLMTHDVCGPGTFGIFEKEFGPDAKIWDPERVVLIPDHYIFTEDPRANRNVDMLRQSLYQTFFFFLKGIPKGILLKSMESSISTIFKIVRISKRIQTTKAFAMWH